MQLKRIKIWDSPLRIFHWALPILLGSSWYSAELGAMDWHLYFGYTLLGLLAFRLCWGLWGSQTARFSSFIKSPVGVLAYVRGQTQAEPVTGHSPLSGYAVLVLLLTLTVQVMSGLFSVDVDGIESGPLSYLVSFDLGRDLAELHEVSFNVLLALVAIHLTAILWYELVRKERLVLAMLHGFKKINAKQPQLYSSWLRLGSTIGLSILLVYLLNSAFWR